MYDASKFLNIDILRADNTWKHLEKYNQVLYTIWDTGMDGKPVTYDIPNGGAPDWFDPRKCRNIGYTATYPKTHPIQQDPRFNLAMDCYGHSTLAMIDILYKGKTDIFIEEIGVGMGNLIFYLSKLGYKNFHLIDDFSQISKKLMDKVMNAGDIKYFLNSKHFPATVTNLVQCPTYFKFDEKGKSIIPETLELFCSHGHMNIGSPMAGIDMREFFGKHNFTCLARNPYDIMYMFCRENKYEEFKEKLIPYVLPK